MRDYARSGPAGTERHRRATDRRPLHDAISADLPHEWPAYLASTQQLLAQGGDVRVTLDPTTGLNKYGCPAVPDPRLLAFGSSTASIVSDTGFIAAERLRQRLLDNDHIDRRGAIYTRELARQRAELVELCGLADLSGLDVVFAPSGTDIHLLAAQLASAGDPSSLRAIMVEPAETGSGVTAALAGRHFSSRTALGIPVVEGSEIGGYQPIDVVTVLCRKPDGALRSEPAVSGDIVRLAHKAVEDGKRVLLTVVDVSKTGLIMPSIASALALRDRMPDTVQLLVDACQFRLAPATLRAYLEQGCLVALTGSKFVTGPAFSGALLVPKSIARGWRGQALAPALSAYTARGEWPAGWQATSELDDPANYGLLLRWEAALAELRAFRSVPEAEITKVLYAFSRAMQERLANDPAFEPLPTPTLDRRPLIHQAGWDEIPTIFPFLLRRASADAAGTYLTRPETQRAYALLGKDLTQDFTGIPVEMTDAAKLRGQVGQPVACGTRAGMPVSALRICASVRHVAASARDGDGGAAVIRQALAVLDKAALIARLI